jgi:hypothetical protein
MRSGRVQDVEEGLSEFPHVIVNQARMPAYIRDHMERLKSRRGGRPAGTCRQLLLLLSRCLEGRTAIAPEETATR